jgi:hypothetical protein
VCQIGGYRAVIMRSTVTFRKTLWPPILQAGLWRILHDAVVAAAGAGGAGAGAVAAEHLRGGPAVQLHQVALGAAVVEPGVAEMMPEPVRGHLDAALAAAPGDDLVKAAGGHRPPVIDPEPQLRTACLGVPGTGTDIPVEAAGGVVADLDRAGLALAADGDLPVRASKWRQPPPSAATPARGSSSAGRPAGRTGRRLLLLADAAVDVRARGRQAARRQARRYLRVPGVDVHDARLG